MLQILLYKIPVYHRITGYNVTTQLNTGLTEFTGYTLYALYHICGYYYLGQCTHCSYVQHPIKSSGELSSFSCNGSIGINAKNVCAIVFTSCFLSLLA